MNRRPKIYFGSQIATTPPTIIMMCNMPQGFPPGYRRYLLNVFRENLPFGEVPIKMYLQKRDSEGGYAKRGARAEAGEVIEGEDETLEDDYDMDDMEEGGYEDSMDDAVSDSFEGGEIIDEENPT